ncbi:MAG: polyprenyl synthetase family protein [Bacteroidota bacterium]
MQQSPSIARPSLNQIKAPIAAELKTFEQYFRDAMKSKVSLLDRVMHYIVKRKGKQVRPMFVFLCAKACGDIQEPTYVGASMIEILHTASLVHDDIVDDAHKRRGFFSVNALWKNKIAVLVGDYLFSQGLLIALRNKEFQLLEIMSEAVEAMSEGELLQIEKARRLDIKEPIYYEVIRGKTASLIASSCAAGAASVRADKETVQLMRLFGEKIGMAFQIRDDLLDYGDEDIGKPRGIDIKEKKMTLPLIYALNHATKSERRHIINLIKRHNENPKKVGEVIDFVWKSGGIQYTEKRMNEFRSEAFELLHKLPLSPARESLEDLVNFVVERKK